MKTKQINITVGFKIPFGYGGALRYEITEICDVGPDENRDQILKAKRIELTTEVYDHVRKMRDRLDHDEKAREKK